MYTLSWNKWSPTHAPNQGLPSRPKGKVHLPGSCAAFSACRTMALQRGRRSQDVACNRAANVTEVVWDDGRSLENKPYHCGWGVLNSFPIIHFVKFLGEEEDEEEEDEHDDELRLRLRFWKYMEREREPEAEPEPEAETVRVIYFNHHQITPKLGNLSSAWALPSFCVNRCRGPSADRSVAVLGAPPRAACNTTPPRGGILMLSQALKTYSSRIKS